MRTIIEIPEDQINALDVIRKRRHTSRATLIRSAIEYFLQRESQSSLETLPGFGAWKNQEVDGLHYQEKLRDTWLS